MLIVRGEDNVGVVFALHSRIICDKVRVCERGSKTGAISEVNGGLLHQMQGMGRNWSIKVHVV